MFSARPVAFDEAASLVAQQQATETTTSSSSTATKHTLPTISPPDTPGAVDNSSTRSSPTVALTPNVKRSRMDSTDETGFDASVIGNARLSVVANGSRASSTVNTSVKYDRQIRIWGDHGQAALQSGCVYIIGHSMTACEVAKNLSLAGVGSLVFVDTGMTTSIDSAKRQALPPLHGFDNRPMCDAMAHWTMLFNPSATITCLRLKSIEDLPRFVHDADSRSNEQDHNLYRRPSCVVICNPSFIPSFDSLVESLLPIPVIVCSTVGLLSYSRVCLPSVYPIVETHSEYAVDDLRLLEPFPGLLSAYESLNFDELSLHERRSVPWPLIVLHFLRKLFPNVVDGVALTSKDRDTIKQHIRELSRQDARAEQNEESENYQQAIKGLNAALTAHPGLPASVSEILANKHVDESTESFWLMCAGLRQFVEGRTNCKYPLPLRGTIPDISASTLRFVCLQEVYRRQADTDASAIHHHVLDIARHRKVSPEDMPTFADVQLFCRNAAFLSVIHGVSLQDEDLKSAEDWSNFEQYIAMRAFDEFCSTDGRLPTPTDLNEVIKCVKKLFPAAPDQSALLSELIYCAQSPEVCAPVMGGVISHEAVKLITGQFVPVNNVLIFDGRTKSISSHTLSSTSENNIPL